MLPSILILAIILLYAGFVIRRKIKQIKAGQHCSCGCDSCPSTSKCKK